MNLFCQSLFLLVGCTSTPDPPPLDDSTVVGDTGTDTRDSGSTGGPCVRGELSLDVSLSAQPAVAELQLSLSGGEDFTPHVRYVDANGQALVVAPAQASALHRLWVRLLSPNSEVVFEVDATTTDGVAHCPVTGTVETGSIQLDGVVDYEVETSDTEALADAGSLYFLQRLNPDPTSEVLRDMMVLRDMSGRVVWGIEPDVTRGPGNLIRSSVISRDGERILVLLEGRQPSDPGMMLVYDWAGTFLQSLILERGGHHQMALGEGDDLFVLGYEAGWNGVDVATTDTGTVDVFGDALVRFTEEDGAGEVLWKAEDDLPASFEATPQPGAGHVNPSYANGLGCTPDCGVSLAGEWPGFALQGSDGTFHTYYRGVGGEGETYGASPHDIVIVGGRLAAVYDRRIDACSGFRLWSWEGEPDSLTSLGQFTTELDGGCGKSVTNGGIALIDHGDGVDPERFRQALFHTNAPHPIELVSITCDGAFTSCESALELRLVAPDGTEDLDPGFGEIYTAEWLTGG